MIDRETMEMVVNAAPQLLDPKGESALRQGQGALTPEGERQLQGAAEALQSLAALADCGALEVFLTKLGLGQDLNNKLRSFVCDAWDKCYKAQLEAAEASLANSEAMVLAKARSSRAGDREPAWRGGWEEARVKCGRGRGDGMESKTNKRERYLISGLGGHGEAANHCGQGGA